MRTAYLWRVFLEGSLPAWLLLGVQLWLGGGRADFGLAGLAALLFAGIWPALRLRPPTGSAARRAGLCVQFGVALAASQLAAMLLVAAAVQRLAGPAAPSGANTPTQAFVMLLTVTALPFLLARVLVVFPGAVRGLGGGRLLGRTLGVATLGLALGYALLVEGVGLQVLQVFGCRLAQIAAGCSELDSTGHPFLSALALPAPVSWLTYWNPHGGWSGRSRAYRLGSNLTRESPLV